MGRHTVTAFALALSLAATTREDAAEETSRAELPSPEARAAAAERIREIYRDQYADKKPPARHELARTLLEAAAGASDEAARHAYLEEARQVAAGSGHVIVALLAVGRMATHFKVDGAELEEETLEKLQRSTRAPRWARLLAATQLERATHAFLRGDYRESARAASKAAAAGKKAKSALLPRRAAKLKAVATRARTEHGRVKKWIELEEPSTDPGVNLALGRYHCLQRGDWKRGLPFLARGRDAALAAVAARDIENPARLERRMEIAAAWWDVSRKARTPERDHLLSRALWWYDSVVPLTGGEMRDEMRARVRTVRESIDSAVPNLVSHGAFLFDGRDDLVILHPLKLQSGDPMTIEAIVQPAMVQPGETISRGATIVGNDGETGFRLGTDDRGYWVFAVRDGDAQRVARSDQLAMPFLRVHLAGVIDGGRMRLFVDGAPQARTAGVGGGTAASKRPVVIGASPDAEAKGGRAFFAGVIDQVRMTRSALYDKAFAEVDTLVEDASTHLMLHFDREPENDLTRDSSDNFFDGDVSGARFVRWRAGVPWSETR